MDNYIVIFFIFIIAMVSLTVIETENDDSRKHHVFVKNRRCINSYFFAASLGRHWTGAV